MTAYRIPFNRPTVLGTEVAEMANAVACGHLSGDGPYTKKCHAVLESVTGTRKALLTTSCTHALEMAAILLDIGPGDEVILPSYGFVSTVNAFVLRGAKPVFVDIRPDTLNLDEELVAQAITPKTRAIVPIHYAGVGCNMERLCELSRQSGVPIVEDNAHGLFGKYRGKPLGSFGALATLSFHETKNITCGEGGALLINDESLMERAEIIREKGTNRSRFFRGEIDKYSWVDIGSSYLPSEILAAYLWAQLQAWEQIQRTRCSIWKRYHKELSGWAQENKVGLPVVPDECEQAYHMFYLVFPDEAGRQQTIECLKAKGILSVFHYLPLHLSEMGRRYGGKVGACPVTETISHRLLRLPMSFELSASDQVDVCNTLRYQMI